MRARASCKRLVLPIVTVFSISLWILAFACDVIRVGGVPGDAWSSVALFSTVGALCAAVPGYIGRPSQKGGRSASQETRADPHGPQALRRCAECGLYPATRIPTRMGSGMSTPVLRSIAGFALLLVSAWLGGQMMPSARLCRRW
ncbi:DUF2231 domain-containing protein [Cupriavidus necator]